MKRSLCVLILCCISFVFLESKSFADALPEDAEKMTIDPSIDREPSHITFDYKGGVQEKVYRRLSRDIQGDNDESRHRYKFTTGCDWITLQPSSFYLRKGDTVTMTIKCEFYEGSRNRSCNINREGYGTSFIVDQTFSVVPEITALLSGYELACDSGSTLCEVKNIGNGTLNWTSSVQVDWAKIVPSSGTIGSFSSQTLSLVYEANTTHDERFFAITFSSDEAINKYASLRLSQPKCTSTLCLQDTVKQVSAVSGTCSFYISNCGGDQFNWQLAENSDWFRVEPANGLLQKGQSAQISIVYDENLLPNERSGTVTINAENAFDSPQTFKLIQDEYGKPSAEGEINISEEGERSDNNVISYTLSDSSSCGCAGLSLKSQLTSLGDWLLGGLAVMLLFVISAGKGL